MGITELYTCHVMQKSLRAKDMKTYQHSTCTSRSDVFSVWMVKEKMIHSPP